LIFSRFSNFADSGSRSSQVRDFRASQVQDSDLRGIATLGLRRLKIPDLRRFATSGLRRFKIPDFCRFATSGLRRFKIPDLHRFNVPENLFHEFRQTRRSEGDKFFPEFPNTSPSGKRVDFDDPIRPKTLKFSKKTSPSKRQSGHASSGNLATVGSRRVLEMPPLPL
jgi:hypothetical protein